jgi:hypothetical protein
MRRLSLKKQKRRTCVFAFVWVVVGADGRELPTYAV